MTYSTRPIQPGDTDEVVRLMAHVMGFAAERREIEFHRWKHEDNPFGASFGRVALDPGGEIVAVRLFLRWRFTSRAGERFEMVRAVDTVTHPRAARQGLFTRLTLECIEDLEAAGVRSIFNTPNGQSGPGNLKLGWQPIGKAPIAMRLTRRLVSRQRAEWQHSGKWGLPTEVGRPADETDWAVLAPPPDAGDRLATAVTPDFLAWRYRLSSLHYRTLIDERDGTTAIVCRVRSRGPRRDLVICQELGDAKCTAALAKQALRETNADVAVRVQDTRQQAGFVTLRSRGPEVFWRPVADGRERSVDEIRFAYGDLELF